MSPAEYTKTEISGAKSYIYIRLLGKTEMPVSFMK